MVLLRLDARGHLDKDFGHRGIRSAKAESEAEATAVLNTPAGVVVLLETVADPVLDFAAGGVVRRSPVSEHAQKVFRVQGTVSGGRLIVGWVALGGKSPAYHLSVIPLEP